MEKILALFVESGIVYCILWVRLVYALCSMRYSVHFCFSQVLVVVYQSETLNMNQGSDAAQLRFIFGFHYFVEGCLISIIVCCLTIHNGDEM